jgi:predicted DNA-binding transcriptional regulator YafY
MSDNSSLRRHWHLLTMLSSRHHGLTVSDMVDALGVSAKTIRRDIVLFRSVGIPLEETVGDFGRKKWRLTRAGNPVPLSFSFDEAAALYLGRRLLEPLAGTAFGEASGRAFQKIRATLGQGALDYVDCFGRLFHNTTLGAGDYARKTELVDGLLVAIEDRKAVHITYQSQRATEPTTREVFPYGLVYHRGSLYLVAFAPEHEQIRHYKIDRISAVEVGPFPFFLPDNFNLSDHLADSFAIYAGTGRVVVRVKFLSPVVRYVKESKWHHSQRLIDQKDGGLVAEFKLSGTEEIKRWVLSFGAQAVVLEPAELRREMMQELREMVEAYGSLSELRAVAGADS